MQQKRVYWIFVIGLVAMVGAWGLRHQLQRRRIQPLTTQQTTEQEIARLRKAVTANPRDISARWALIDFYNRYGLLDPAGEQIVALLKLDPKDQKARLALANALFAKRRYPLAEASYRDVLDMDPKSLEAWQGICAVMIKEGRYLEANTVAQYAQKVAPKDPNTHLLLATSALEYADQFPDAAAHAGELDFARKELEYLKTVLPNNPEIYYDLGRCYRGLHNAPAAINNLEVAHKFQPNRQDIGHLLAVGYRAANNRPAAQKVLEELAVLPGASGPVYDLLGQIYQVGSQPDSAQKALEAFKKAVEKEPKLALFQEHLGSAYYRVGNMEAARSTFEKVTFLAPERSYAFQQLALIYTRLDQPKMAARASEIAKDTNFNEQQLTQIQELVKKHNDSINLHLLLAKRYHDLHMDGPSRDEYIMILKLDPKNPNVPADIRRVAQSYIPLQQ